MCKIQNQKRKNTNDMHHWFCHTISVCAKWHKILIQGHKFQARYVQKVVSFENENRTQFYQMNKNCYHNRIILKPMPEHSKGANRTQRSYSKLFMDRMPSKNRWLLWSAEKYNISGIWYVQYLLNICKILLLHVRKRRWIGKYVEIVK